MLQHRSGFTERRIASTGRILWWSGENKTAHIEDLRIVRPYFATTASYEGTTFLTMQFEATGPKIDKELDRVKSQFKSMDTFGWRYIPKAVSYTHLRAH